MIKVGDRVRHEGGPIMVVVVVDEVFASAYCEWDEGNIRHGLDFPLWTLTKLDDERGPNFDAPVPPDDTRPPVLGGECARCFARPPYHEATCPTRTGPVVRERTDRVLPGSDLDIQARVAATMSARFYRAAMGSPEPIPEQIGLDVRPYFVQAGKDARAARDNAKEQTIGFDRTARGLDSMPPQDGDVIATVPEGQTMTAGESLGRFDPRASLTIGPLTIYEDGQIKVAEGVKREEIGSLVLAAVKEGQDHAVREERAALTAQIESDMEDRQGSFVDGLSRAVDIIRERSK